MSSAPVGSSANTTLGLADERARDRDALLLAARELGRPVAATRSSRPTRSSASRTTDARQPPAGEPRRQRDVLLGGQRAEQVEGLEDEADALAAQPGERPLAEPAELVLAEADAALRRPVQAGGDLQQRRLARSPTAP